ncbi:MAG: peroxiredoxin family protein [Acidobacteria bacterium]|nr:peroxiredoxin family protein [Acidobacteriota bacterium]
MRAQWKRILTVAVFTSMALVASAGSRVGDQAPSFQLTALDGETVSLEQLRGQIVVIHFAASW